MPATRFLSRESTKIAGRVYGRSDSGRMAERTKEHRCYDLRHSQGMAIFGNRTSRPAQWLNMATSQSRRVGKVLRDNAATGSGFLCDGGMFGTPFAGLPFCVTVPHVEGTAVVFEGMFDDPSRSVASQFVQELVRDEDYWYSIHLLDRWPGKVPDLIAAPGRPRSGDPVFVIGYPMGAGLAVSLEDNAVLEQPHTASDSTRLFYRSPTAPGSSGSAVFNEKWEIVAVHQGSEHEVSANFGLAFDVLAEAATQRLLSVDIAPGLAERARTVSASQTDQSTPEYFSVFISYSHDDAAFATRLYNALQASGIRAWLDRRNMLPGDDIYEEVHKGIQQWDKILLCCSKSSLSSWWVDSEIDRAFQKERDLWKARQRRVNALIPLDLDGYLLDGWDSGKAQNVRARLAADFRGWQDDRAFEASLEQLRRALRADAGAREQPPTPRL